MKTDNKKLIKCYKDAIKAKLSNILNDSELSEILKKLSKESFFDDDIETINGMVDLKVKEITNSIIEEYFNEDELEKLLGLIDTLNDISDDDLPAKTNVIYSILKNNKESKYYNFFTIVFYEELEEYIGIKPSLNRNMFTKYLSYICSEKGYIEYTNDHEIMLTDDGKSMIYLDATQYVDVEYDLSDYKFDEVDYDCKLDDDSDVIALSKDDKVVYPALLLLGNKKLDYDTVSISITVQVWNNKKTNKTERVVIKNAKYHKELDYYCISESEANDLRKRGVTICPLITREDWRDYLLNKTNNWESIGILAGHGFHVGESAGITYEQGTQILTFIVANKLMTKSRLISYLTWLRKMKQKYPVAYDDYTYYIEWVDNNL